MTVTTQPLLDITVERAGPIWHVGVAGELDIASGHELLTMAESLAASPGPVEFDLSEVTFTDTAGWRAVQAASAQVVHLGARPEVVATSASVDYLLERLGLDAASATAR